MSVRNHKIYFVTVVYEEEIFHSIEDDVDGGTYSTGRFASKTETLNIVAPAYKLGEMLTETFVLERFQSRPRVKDLMVVNIKSFALDGFIENHTY